MGTVVGQLIAAIADIELTLDQWPDLIPALLHGVTASPTPLAKKSTLQCIGFICEIVQTNVLSNHSNAILTAVADGARKEETRFMAILKF